MLLSDSQFQLLFLIISKMFLVFLHGPISLAGERLLLFILELMLSKN